MDSMSQDQLKLVRSLVSRSLSAASVRLTCIYHQNRELEALSRHRIDPERLHFRTGSKASLGRGGFGVVKLAELSSPDQVAPVTVAVKQLHSDDSVDVRVRVALVSFTSAVSGGRSNICPQRLVREMKIWSDLHHPNILRFIGFHLDAEMDDAFLISLFEPLGDVAQYIEKEQPSIDARFELVSPSACLHIPCVQSVRRQQTL